MEVCAVGDGTNDELMIREAHCGIGIGIEPTADTRTFSDRQVMQHAFNCHEHRDFFTAIYRSKTLAVWRHFCLSKARAR